jgi:hypothetical protein
MRIIAFLHRSSDRMDVHIRNHDPHECRGILWTLKESLSRGTPQELMVLDRMCRPDPELDDPDCSRMERVLFKTGNNRGGLRMLGSPAPVILTLLVLVLQFLEEVESGRADAAHRLIQEYGPRASCRRASVSLFRDDSRGYVRATFHLGRGGT